MQHKSPFRIYLASSWRNENYPAVVKLLRNAGHDVYDFRNPAHDNSGFSWSDLETDLSNCTAQNFVKALAEPAAQAGFAFDKKALDWCNVCVLLLPCGLSAHLEAGYIAGQGKHVVICLTPTDFRPELMYKLASGIVTSQSELLAHLARIVPKVEHAEPLHLPCPNCGSFNIHNYSKSNILECNDCAELRTVEEWQTQSPRAQTHVARLRKELDEIKSAGKKMRECQKDYFRSRKHRDLISSKEFEKRFDELINKPVRTEIQGSLVS